ncbi:hypothetical protein VPH35_128589 [Triticum aestivum]
MPSRAPAHSAPASTTSRGPSRPSSAPSMTATTPCRSISSSSSTTTSGAPRCTSRAVLLARRTWVRPSSSSCTSRPSPPLLPSSDSIFPLLFLHGSRTALVLYLPFVDWLPSGGVPQGVQVEEPQEQVCHCCKAAGGRWKSLSESIMVYQLCKGVAFCHGRGVRHHDLEPHNLQIGGWVGIIWFDPSKRKYSLLFINQRHFLLSWMDGTPSI